MRYLWMAAGIVALLVGTIGIFLPILPTTPFVLIAAFAFGRGSQKLHNWLSGNSVFGPIIQDWEEHGTIAVRYRRIAYGAMALMIAVSLVKGLHPAVLLIQAMGIGWAVMFIRARPTRSADDCV